MAGVPFIFGNATTSIPLSNLDADFNTGLTIGNTTVGLGNTVTSLGNLTLANSTIQNGSQSNVTITTIQEPANVSPTGTAGSINMDVANASILYLTSNATGNITVNFRASSTTTLNNFMPANTVVSCSVLSTQGSTAYVNANVTIDGTGVTPKWQGGSAPTSGNANSVDTYAYAILKTAANVYTILASQTQFK